MRINTYSVSLPTFHLTACATIALALFLALTGTAHAALPAGSTFGLVSESDMELNTYTTVLGNIYAGGTLNLDFGYGIQTHPNGGNVYSRGDLTQGGLADVAGSVFTNGAFSIAGLDSVTGNVTYGTTLSKDSFATVNGSIVQQPSSVPIMALPSATVFSSGGQSYSGSTDLNLAPGSYGDIAAPDFASNTLTLSSGNYYLNSLSLGNWDTLSLNLTGNSPIHIFVTGDISIANGVKVDVNGTPIDNYNVVSTMPTSLSSLASDVLFETHGNFTLNSGLINSFFGNIFAPDGSVTGIQVADEYGAILAQGPINGYGDFLVEPSTYLFPAPEPSGVVLGLMGLAGLAAWGWWRQRSV